MLSFQDIVAVTTATQYNNGNGPNISAGGHSVGDIVGSLECVFSGGDLASKKSSKASDSPQSAGDKGKNKDKPK